jgi:glycosyltransferase involved in cell wall biosynthesis
MKNRYQLLDEHSNDYGFNVSAIDKDGLSLPLLSIIIPYFNTGEIFKRTLHFLHNAVMAYGGQVEVIVVDDGSTFRPLLKDWLQYDEQCILHPVNQGRTAARNTGLSEASGDIILFMDSDILVDESLILEHAAIHQTARQRNVRPIVISFFEFIQDNDNRIMLDSLQKKDIALNDFRIDCTYQASWIGCEADKAYIGQHLELIEETNNLRDWKGQYKAWMLPNMVLGGAFSVLRQEILAIDGFDARFSGYGFTETSAVTRMIAERNNMVIPSLSGGALHVEDGKINLSKSEKDEIFKDKHHFYFNVFLQEEIGA